MASEIGGEEADIHTLLALRKYSDVSLSVASDAVDVDSDVGSGDGDVCLVWRC